MSDSKSFSFLSGFTSNKWVPVGLSLLFVIVVGSISFKHHKIGDYGLETDFYMSYIPAAQVYEDGGLKIHNHQGPIYPIALATVKGITGDYFTAGMWINLISMAFFLFFVFKFVARMLNSDLALLTTLITAVNPHVIQNTYSCGTDMLFLAFAGGVVYFLTRRDDYKWYEPALVGLFAGLAYLVRYNGLVFIPVLVFVTLVVNIWKTSWKNRAIATGILVATFFAVITPYGLYCLEEKGSFFFSKNHINIAWEYFGEGNISWEELWQGTWLEDNGMTSLGGVIFYDFGAFLSKFFSNMYEHFVEDMNQLIGWVFGILVLVGIAFLAIDRPKNRQLISYLLIGLGFYALLCLTFYGPRFSMFLVPFYLVLAFRIFTSEKLEKFKSLLRFGVPVFGLIMFFVTIGEAKSHNEEIISSGPMELVKLGKWFDRHEKGAKETDIIWCRKPHVAHALGLKMKKIALIKSETDFWDGLRDDNVKYIYYGDFEMRYRPQLKFLTEPKKVPPVFQLLHVQTHVDKKRRGQVAGFLYKVDQSQLDKYPTAKTKE